LGTRFGAAAVDNLFARNTGVMVGIKDGMMVTTELETVLATRPELSAEALRLAEPLSH
jgi:6-phosphofructokinase